MLQQCGKVLVLSRREMKEGGLDPVTRVTEKKEVKKDLIILDRI